MPNVFLETDMVTAETLDHFDGGLVLAKMADRQHESKFAKEGAKIGDTVRLRRANNPTVSEGNNFDPQNIDEASRSLTINRALHVDYIVDNADFYLTWDRAVERYFQPAGRALANKVDSELAKLYNKIANFVGTYNTAPTTIGNFSACLARAESLGWPPGDRHFVLDPSTMDAAFVAMSGLFANATKISKQYDTGRMGKNVLGADWDSDNNIRAHTTGAGGGTPACNGIPTSGATTLAVNGWTASITDVVLFGDIFTIAGVNAAHPITGEDLGFLRQFVIMADASSDGSGETTLSIDPPIISSGGRKTVTALPANGALLTFVTTLGGVVANCPLYFHKNWVALAIAAQGKIPNVTSSMQYDPDGGGIGIRYAMWWDGDSNQWKIRFDCLLGMVVQMPELCLRIGTS